MGQREHRQPVRHEEAPTPAVGAPLPSSSSCLEYARQDKETSPTPSAGPECTGFATRGISLCSGLQAFLDSKPKGKRSEWVHVALHRAMEDELGEAGQLEAELQALAQEEQRIAARRRLVQTKLHEAKAVRGGVTAAKVRAYLIAAPNAPESSRRKWAESKGITWEQFQALAREVSPPGRSR